MNKAVPFKAISELGAVAATHTCMANSKRSAIYTTRQLTAESCTMVLYIHVVKSFVKYVSGLSSVVHIPAKPQPVPTAVRGDTAPWVAGAAGCRLPKDTSKVLPRTARRRCWATVGAVRLP